MAPKADKIIHQAFDKVTARHRALRASAGPVPFEQFIREVIAEACAEVGRREARSLRKIRKAARRAREAAGLITVMGQSPVFGDIALELWFADFDPGAFSAMTGEQRQADPQGGAGAPVAGPPSWHPEHRGNDESN